MFDQQQTPKRLEKYVTDEWMLILRNAQRNLWSECPLIEDEVFVAIHHELNRLQIMESRIDHLFEFIQELEIPEDKLSELESLKALIRLQAAEK